MSNNSLDIFAGYLNFIAKALRHGGDFEKAAEEAKRMASTDGVQIDSITKDGNILKLKSGSVERTRDFTVLT